MSRLARVLFTVAILASSATTAFAYYKYPPGPPYRFCPDSVTIFQVQQSDTLLNPCFPAIGDTLLGVSGIVTGKRLRSTARLYIENSNAADFNGLQIYVSDQTYNSQFVLGDSVVAYGLSQYYQNESQIQGALGLERRQAQGRSRPGPDRWQEAGQQGQGQGRQGPGPGQNHHGCPPPARRLRRIQS